MTNPEMPKLPNPAERALALNGEIYDLRNQLLFERIGKEGMEAMAAHASEGALFSQIGELSPEVAAMASTFENQEYEDLSQEFYQQGFEELAPAQKERVRQSAKLLREHSHDIQGDDNGILAQAARERDEVDNELNRVYNRPVSSAFKYKGSQQTVDEFIVYNDNPTAMIPFPVEGVKFVPQVKIKRTEKGVEALAGTQPVDETTLLPIDLIKIGTEQGLFVSEEEVEETRRWLDGNPIDDGGIMVTDIAERLERVKAYLEDHLDPTTQSRRMGLYGLEDPDAEPGT